jgi:hypothetical protein
MFHKLKVLSILAFCLIALTASVSGCARKIVLHPLTDEDIRFESKAGTNWTCMSDYYVEEVMRARLGE